MVRRIHPLLFAMAFVLTLAAVDSTAMGRTFIKTHLVNLEHGIADFGGGTTHNNGRPVLPGTIDWDLTPDANGVLIATARVRGTLFLDTCFGGWVRLRITFSDVSGNETLSVLNFDKVNLCNFCNQCANHSANQRLIDVSFSGSTLGRVTFNLFRVSPSGVLTPLHISPDYYRGPELSIFLNQEIINDPREFHGRVDFERSNGNMQGTVRGRIYTNGTPGTTRLITEFQTIDGTVLQRVITDSTATSRPNNHNVNVVSNTLLVQGRLFKIRLLLGAPLVFPNGVQTVLNPVVKTYDYVSGTLATPGTFQLAPEDAVVGVGQRLNNAFTWTVPDPLNWHDLQALRLRVLSGSDVVISVYFDEATQTFAPFDEATGKLGQAYPAGSNQRLQTPNAMLYMKDSGLQASGPSSPSVTLFLSLSFKAQLAGEWLAVEAAASDDEGNHGAFEPAGSITVY